MAPRTVIEDARGSRVTYEPGFLARAERDALVAELAAARDRFDRDLVTMYGRTVAAPRLVCAFGDPGLRYRYAGVDRATHPWAPALGAVRDRLAALAGHPFTYALVNLYRDGDDCIGWHSDKTGDLQPGSSIASLSLGAERPFRFAEKATGAELEVTLEDASLLWMHGATQRHWKHTLPRVKGLREPRLNVTFRAVRA